MTAGLVRLPAGARLMLDSAEWEVEECLPQSGRVVLRGAGGKRLPVTIRALVNDPGLRPVPAPAGGAGREAVLEDLAGAQWEQLHLRVAHVLEAELSMATRDRLIRQYVAERHGPEVAVPSYSTLKRTWLEWFGPGGSRPRYARSAAAAPPTGRHVVIHRPGQVVALDTTVLPVKVRESVFGEPVSAHLTLALDAYTHSVVAFRLTLVSDTSVDVAMLLRDVMMPLPMREGWGEDMEWPYPGVPAAVVAEFAGHKVAGLPFFAPRRSPRITDPSTRTTIWSRWSG